MEYSREHQQRYGVKYYGRVGEVPYDCVQFEREAIAAG